MRLSITCRLLLLICTGLGLVSSVQAQGAAPWPSEFALTFEPGATAYETQGAPGNANASNMARLLAVLSLRQTGAAFEVLLTGPRPTSCRSEDACSQLLFARIRHVNTALAQRDAAAAGRGVAETINRYAEDMRQLPVLPTVQGSADVLFVRTQLSKPYAADAKCPLIAHIGDPLLPLGLDGRPVEVQVVSPRTLTVTPNSTVRVTPSGHEGRYAALVWESGNMVARGALANAVALSTLMDGRAERFHLIAATTANNRILRAAEALSMTPKVDSAGFIESISHTSMRGFDDTAQRPGALGAERPAADLITCGVSITVRTS